MNNWNQGGKLSWLIVAVGLATAGFTGLFVWFLFQSSEAVSGYGFITVAMSAAGCVAIMVFANTAYLIYLFERQKAELTAVNGYSLEAMENIIDRVYKAAALEMIRRDVNIMARKFDTGFSEKGEEEKLPLRFPKGIQDELEHIFIWMNTPTRDKFFRNYEEFFCYLAAARARLETYRSA